MNNWLSLTDILPIIKKQKVNAKNKIKIITYEQVHKVIGLITKSIQEFELAVKKLLKSLNVRDEKLALKGIGDLIAHLGNKNVIKEKDIQVLRQAAKIRNYISHHFYLEWKDKDLYNLKTIEKVLNGSKACIDNARALIDTYYYEKTN